MSIMPLDRESILQGDFYVPRFEVRIDGVGLPDPVLRDVTQVTYRDNIKEIDSVELTVNNWDPADRRFKYIGSETPNSLQQDPLYRLFEPCNKTVQVQMGYEGFLGLVVMLTGTFTTMEPIFPSGSAPTLTVRALNVLHKLRRKQYTTTWGEMRDSDIIKNIETLKDQGEKRFPLPIEIDTNARNDEPILPIVTQKSMYDIDFILTRARERGYVVFIKEEDPAKKLPRRLYFGPSDGQAFALRPVTFELQWGKSLIDFKPTLTTANQVNSVTVNGWDRRTRKAITAKVTLEDREFKQNRDLYYLLKECDPREEIVVDEPVFTQKDARNRAIAILKDRQKEMVKASGTTIGLPDLRAGQRILIKGIGSRLSGKYFVTDTTHTIGDSGYITRFNARREDDGQGGK